MITREKVLITVKTYPTLSEKYGELVCTAGLKENGTWIRIYPLPFRRFKEYKQFSKYTWIELPLQRNSSDPRPESFRPVGWDEIKILEIIGTKNNWEARKKIILKNNIYDNIDLLIKKAKENQLSIAVFKPTEIIDFIWEEVTGEWGKNKLESVLIDLKQGLLFEPEEFVKDFKIIPKLPYRFFYIFKDSKGKKSKLMLEDWEAGQLFWNCMESSKNELEALKKVRQKYYDDFVSNKDLYFFLGTTRQFHFVGKNPFLIIGVFYPPKEIQKRFDFELK